MLGDDFFVCSTTEPHTDLRYADESRWVKTWRNATAGWSVGA